MRTAAPRSTPRRHRLRMQQCAARCDAERSVQPPHGPRNTGRGRCHATSHALATQQPHTWWPTATDAARSNHEACRTTGQLSCGVAPCAPCRPTYSPPQGMGAARAHQAHIAAAGRARSRHTPARQHGHMRDGFIACIPTATVRAGGGQSAAWRTIMRHAPHGSQHVQPATAAHQVTLHRAAIVRRRAHAYPPGRIEYPRAP